MYVPKEISAEGRKIGLDGLSSSARLANDRRFRASFFNAINSTPAIDETLFREKQTCNYSEQQRQDFAYECMDEHQLIAGI